MPNDLATAPPDIQEAFGRLNDRQRALALALPLAATPADAAVSVGYSEKTAAKKAKAMANHPDVALVARFLAQGAGTPLLPEMQSTIEEVDRIAQELVAVGFRDPIGIFDENDNVLPVREWPEEARRSLESIDVFEEFQGKGKDRKFIGYTKKIRFAKKVPALEALAKLRQHGGFSMVKEPVPVQNNYYGVVVLPPKDSGRGNGGTQHVTFDGEAIEGTAVRVKEDAKAVA